MPLEHRECFPGIAQVPIAVSLSVKGVGYQASRTSQTLPTFTTRDALWPSSDEPLKDSESVRRSIQHLQGPCVPPKYQWAVRRQTECLLLKPKGLCVLSLLVVGECEPAQQPMAVRLFLKTLENETASATPVFVSYPILDP
jgi:hypothetical protein